MAEGPRGQVKGISWPLFLRLNFLSNVADNKLLTGAYPWPLKLHSWVMKRGANEGKIDVILGTNR